MTGKSLTLLASLFLLQQGCDYSESTESKSDSGKDEQPSETDKKAENNPLLKELLEIIREDKEKDGVISDRGVKFIERRVEETYAGMNQALSRKDLPKFMDTYREAVEFRNQLMGISPTYAGISWVQLFDDLNIGYFGNIATRVLASAEILEDWPQDCGSLDFETRKLAQELYRFNRNRRLSKGDKVDDREGTEHYILHDDAGLALATAKNLHPYATAEGEGRHFLNGTYTKMRFSTPADLLVYALFTTTHKSENPLESVVERCDFIDLGIDGIDRCDAKLNGVPDNDSAMKAANEKARECMAVTSKKLRQRYAGTGFFKK